MDLAYEYTRRRADFGRHPKFQDSAINTICDIQPSKEFDRFYIERENTILDIDCIPEVSEHWVNTERFIQDDKGMNHLEGGWPKEVNTQEFSEKQRHIRKIETDETFEGQAHELASRAQALVMQNNAIDVFETYFTDICEDHTGELPSAKTVTIFRDPHVDMPRGVSKICWHPDSGWKLAVSYCTLQFQSMPDTIPLNSYIWDVTNPNRPDFTIKPQSPLVTLVFNPKSSEHLAGGCYNGLIAFWDLRKGQTPVSKTLIEESHNDPVYDIYWIQSRTGNEFSSVSTDGFIHWWDIRKLGSGPMDSMRLAGEDGALYGGTCMEYRTDAGATRFLIGTEQGMLMTIERKAKKDQESQKSVKAFYGLESGRHHGPVYSVERNFAFPKYILTVGDWAANIWMEDIRTPVMSTPYDPTYLTAGAWSPTRPGVFFTAKKDGVVDVWDYFYKQTEPIVAFKIGEHPLTCMAPQAGGKMLGIGSQDGTTTILEVCSSLVESTLQEKPAIISMFERETNREKNLQNRLLAQRRQAELEKKGKVKKKEGPSVEVPVVTSEKLKESEDKFWNLVKKYKPDRSNYKLGDDAGRPQSRNEEAEHASNGVDNPIQSTETTTQEDKPDIQADAGAIEEATKIESSITTVPQDEEKINILSASKDANSFVKDDDSLGSNVDNRQSLDQSLYEYDTDGAQDAYIDDFEANKPANLENIISPSTVPAKIEESDNPSFDEEKSVNEVPVNTHGKQLRALGSEAACDDGELHTPIPDTDPSNAKLLRALVSESACDDGLLKNPISNTDPLHKKQLRAPVSEAACDDGGLQTPISDGDHSENSESDKPVASTTAADDGEFDDVDDTPSKIHDKEPSVGTNDAECDQTIPEDIEKTKVEDENVISANGNIISENVNENEQLDGSEPKNIEENHSEMKAGDITEQLNVHEPESIEQDQVVTKTEDKTNPEENVESTKSDPNISHGTMSQQFSEDESVPKAEQQILKELDVKETIPTTTQKTEPNVKIESEVSNPTKDSENINELVSTSEQKDVGKEHSISSLKDIEATEEDDPNNDNYEDEFEGGDGNLTKDATPVVEPSLAAKE